MTLKPIFATASLLAALLSGTAFAQDGTDISKAIPIYFGQTIDGIVDSQTKPVQVYSITLAQGQSFSAIVKLDDPKTVCLSLASSAVKTLSGMSCGDSRLLVSLNNGNRQPSVAFNYKVATAGTYYVAIGAGNPGIHYELQVTAEGTPMRVPNPTLAGCLSGRVDSVTYSLQLIAAGLPDEISVGGVKACATCDVKPPMYPEMATRLESALKSKVNVEACYDASGNIFQIKLIQQ